MASGHARAGGSPEARVSEPRVGIIVVSYNPGPHLARCLEAVRAQTLSPARVVVVDNGSGDGSLASRGVLSGAELLALGRNTGFAAAANRGIELAADCAWLALLNPDAFPEPGWLEALVRSACERPEFALLASRQLMADDPSRFDGAGDVYAVSGLAWRRLFGQPVGPSGLQAEEVFGPCAAAALYRRDAVMEAGGFDEGFFCYFEDVDLAFRMRLRGHRCLYVPDAVVHHVGSAVRGRHSAFSLYHGHRNLVWTWWKNMPGSLLATYLPHHLAMNGASLVHFAARGLLPPLLRAKRDALRGLPAVLRTRRAVQAARRASTAELRQAMVSGWKAVGFGRHL